MGTCCSGNPENRQNENQMQPFDQNFESTENKTRNDKNPNLKAGVIDEDYDESNHYPPPEVAHKIDSVPNYFNESTKQTLEKLEPFVYDEDLDENQGLPNLGPYECENQTVYVGQWRNGKKNGRGKQYWTDGSYYEGYWKDSVANGKGRLIHSDGDVYIGQWKDDKAHGYGVYIHTDGSKYEGFYYFYSFH